MANKTTFIVLATALLCMTANATASRIVYPHANVWSYHQVSVWPYNLNPVCTYPPAYFLPYYQDNVWAYPPLQMYPYHQDHIWSYPPPQLRRPFGRRPYRQTVVPSGNIYRPVRLSGSRLQSQDPQPVVIKNYYLSAEAKKESLPYWQGPKPLRLQNPFLAQKKTAKKK